MPTGYTCIIEDKPDTTFREYALRCSRAFSACITQRDEDMGEPPRTRDEGSYYAKSLADAEAEFKRLDTLGQDAIKSEFAAVVAKREAENAASVAKHVASQAAFARMLAAAEAWKAPSKDHARLKKFMVDQIKLDYRPDDKPYTSQPPTSALSWHLERVDSARRHVQVRAEDLVKERERCAESKRWLDALLASLPAEVM